MKYFVSAGLLLVLITIIIICRLLFTRHQQLLTRKYHIAILVIVASCLLEFCISPLRGWRVQISSVCGFFIYLGFTNFFIKRFITRLKPLYTAAFVLFGFLCFQGPMRIFFFTGTLISFPDFLAHLLGIIAGYWFYKRHTAFYKAMLTISTLSVLFLGFYGYDLWIYNLNYGTFDGNVHMKGPQTIVLKNKDNHKFNLQKGKYTVMDFWFIGCGACLNEFPEFQKVYSQYKNNSQIQFYSVNVPGGRDQGEDPFNYLLQFGYNFPMVVSADSTLPGQLQISGYPTIFILDQNGDVIYKGDAKGLPKVLSGL